MLETRDYEYSKDSLSLTVRAFGSIHFVTTGFNPLRTNTIHTECRRHDAYRSYNAFTILHADIWTEPMVLFYLLFIVNGLKSVVTI